jgi:hypothetical protein
VKRKLEILGSENPYKDFFQGKKEQQRLEQEEEHFAEENGWTLPLDHKITNSLDKGKMGK